MRKERANIPLAAIALNEGQLDWLPKNPRQWTQTDLDRTAASIEEDADFLEDRPLLVVPDGKAGYVVFAGNLRREGAEKAGLDTVPCVIYTPETDEDHAVVMRRAMKDNGSFGKTDWDGIYSSEWANLPLSDWGVTPTEWKENPKLASEQSPEVTDAPPEEKGDITIICEPGDFLKIGEFTLKSGERIDITKLQEVIEHEIHT